MDKMDKDFNLDDFLVNRSDKPNEPELLIDQTETANEKQNTYQAKEFLKNTVPWQWILAADRCGSSALIVAIAIHRLTAMAKTNTVKMSNAKIRRMINPTDPRTVQRAIASLVNAGLITVSAKPGQAPWITVLDRYDQTEKSWKASKKRES